MSTPTKKTRFRSPWLTKRAAALMHTEATSAALQQDAHHIKQLDDRIKAADRAKTGDLETNRLALLQMETHVRAIIPASLH